ncbi:hypothetical protein BN1088_1432003 [Sphingobacterium sp. PM2-P1-29]|nr:hypothetical protein BN1088_1432003 [Sphingobacterium sp. PM2-P1-29]
MRNPTIEPIGHLIKTVSYKTGDNRLGIEITKNKKHLYLCLVRLE